MKHKKQHLACELGHTEFHGIRIIKKDGSSEFVRPCKEVKKEVEEYFDEYIRRSTNLKLKDE